MATEVEEVVVTADSLYVEDVLPDRGEGFFDFALRRHMFAARDGARTLERATPGRRERASVKARAARRDRH